MLWQVRRFHRRALAFLRTTDTEDLTTYGEFLEQEGFSGYFIAHYAVPLVSCVWSAGTETTMVYPARYLFRFLDHHGMLRPGGSPQWYTVAGGSRVYVERLAGLLNDVRAARAVTDVTRREDGVQIRDVTGRVTRVDRVVIATHADQALGLLADPSHAEVTTLKQFGYSRNVTVLHTDSSVLPQARNARASWNYRMTSCDRPGQPAVVTYWMNRLQGHQSPEAFLVTLNAGERLDPVSVAAVMHYEHPIYTPDAVRAQSQLGDLATYRTVYAGAYHGWGLPRGRLLLRRRGRPVLRGELVSAPTLPVPEPIGQEPELTKLPPLPALVVGSVTHRRPGPVRHAFRHRVYQWLIDLDSVPRQPAYLRPFASFRSKDHLGDPGLTIKAKVQHYLARSAIDLGDSGRVVMLANARVLGHVFDPLSVFWCYDSNGRLACIVAEVHNTYRERRAYLLHPDMAGVAVTGKDLRVSPFFDVSGSYVMRFALAPDRVSTAVTLRRDGAVAFSATFCGRPQPATRRALARLLIRQPLMTQRVSALIRVHGIWLWLRGLPVRPHPRHIRQEGI
jgi:uncharacterized protein